MTRATFAGGALATGLVLLALAAAYRALERGDAATAAPAAAGAPSAATAAGEAEGVHPSLLYGRVTAEGGATYEGRLRFRGVEEAFWSDYFNGVKRENPWVVHVPPELRPMERRPFEILGIEIGRRDRPLDLGRPFMVRFGDLARLEASGRDVRVTLKSGTRVDLDRFEASDFDDGVWVWDATRGVVDLDSLRIRAIELMPSPRPGAAPGRLVGTVRTRQGEFTGFVQWNREQGVGSDELVGRNAAGEVRLRFDTVRSIARRTPDRSLVTLVDGREVELSGAGAAGDGHRGLTVDDRRYGRVTVSWDAFERLDLDPDGLDGPAGSGPAYDDFPPGRALTGSVTTRGGRRLAGRLVYDLDESETTETLDAPSQGAAFNLTFGLIASLDLSDAAAPDGAPVRVTLHSGEVLVLERRGDLGDRNAGLLVFVDGAGRPEVVPWVEVERVDFDRPAAAAPSPGER